MKAHLTNIEHDRCRCSNLFPREKYSFIGRTEDAENRQIRLEIDGMVTKNPLIKWDQREWEFDIEITITAKPKGKLVVKL